MSEGLKQIVADEVTEQVDAGDLLGDGDVVDSVDGGEIGASVGRQFGEQLGREIGGAIGREIHEAVRRGVENENDLREIGSDVTTAIRDGFRDALEDVEGRDSIESMAKNVTEGSSLEGVLEDDEDEAEADETEADEPETREEEPAEAGTDEEIEGDEDESGPSTEGLEDLRRETLEDFLEVMSYDDLQSVAKDVGVKANLSREEMTDRIIEEVSAEPAE